MLQISVPNVSSIFLDISCRCIYLDVVYVSHICYNFLYGCSYVYNGFQVFSTILQVFQMYVVGVSSVSDVCCKCFV
jgi:hypothetical protein